MPETFDAVSGQMYPTPQYVTRESEIDDRKQVLNLGTWPVPVTAWSVAETSGYAANDWAGSPYALRENEPAKVAESQAKESQISTGFIDRILSSLETAAITTHRVQGLAEQFMDDWNLRPRETQPGATVRGELPAPNVTHYNSPTIQAGMNQKMEQVRQAAESLWGQVKGMFNLDYEPEKSPSPVPTVKQTGWSLAVHPILLAVIVLIIIASK